MTAAGIITAGVAVPCRPWPRHVLAPAEWARLAALDDPTVTFAALWADTHQVHALFDAAGPGPAGLIASTPIEQGGYPALSPLRPRAALFERMIRDLFGHVAQGGIDGRPWLDHGRWPRRLPLSPRPVEGGGEAMPPELHEPALPAADEPAPNQLGLGPAGDVPGGPAHLRLDLLGERIVGAEWRMGYAYRGAAGLMHGSTPRVAARFAARIAGDATVAHAAAFARAVEAALGLVVPPRAERLVDVALSLERAAIGWSRLTAIATDRGAYRFAARCGRWREQLLRACGETFGHRLMMDLVVPGGLSLDPTAAALVALRDHLASLIEACRHARPNLQFPPAASELAALIVGPHAELAAAAAALADLPPGPVLAAAAEARGGEGIGTALGPRGRTLTWLRIENGLITAAAPLDAGLFVLANAELLLQGELLADLQSLVNLSGVNSAGIDS